MSNNETATDCHSNLIYLQIIKDGLCHVTGPVAWLYTNLHSILIPYAVYRGMAFGF